MGFMGEKSNTSDEYVWIVDPLDGTRNYVSGIPFFPVVLGLALNGDVLLGVNYDPMRKEMFHVTRRKGAFLNDKPIHVSRKTMIEDSVLGAEQEKGLGWSDHYGRVCKLYGSWDPQLLAYLTPPLVDTTSISIINLNHLPVRLLRMVSISSSSTRV